MVPSPLSFITCNLWLTERWPARAPALERFLALFTPDVLCVQELQRPTQEFLDRLLSEHDRVHDPFFRLDKREQYLNIYWSKAVFEKIKHGAEEVGHVEPERRMFWARLQLKSLKKPIFVATAHLTSRLHADEMETW